MDLGRIRFFFVEVLANLRRNAAMQLTAVGTVAVALVMLGAFLYVREASGHVGAEILSRIEISVYLKDEVDDRAAHDVERQMQADHRIVRVTYIPKAQGLEQLKSRMAGEIDTSLLTSNPLPNAFRVSVDQPSNVVSVASRIEHLEGVATVTYARDIVTKLLRIADVLQLVGLGLMAILALVSAIIIGNTIRLTVYARRREIAIMQLVGATNGYIRAPFICEGIINGLVGAGVAIGVLAAARDQLLPRLKALLTFLPLSNLAVDERLIVMQLVSVGAAVGAMAAWFAVNRYLRLG